MYNHILLPNIKLSKGLIISPYQQYVSEWSENVIKMIDREEVSASICLQGALIELCQEGKTTTDWLGIFDEYLTESGVPVSYSRGYGKLLNKFDGQYLQKTIHAIHTRWWLESIIKGKDLDSQLFADLIESKLQTDGLFYDKDISETILRHRMKSELTMSFSMAIEILNTADRLNSETNIIHATNLVDPLKCPALGYMSMEYFRLKALRMMQYEMLFPVGIDEHIISCTDDLSFGWCDFSIKSKVDSYMGTAKRGQRDMPIHSPLITCYVKELISIMRNSEHKKGSELRLNNYKRFIQSSPLDIPAFQMRDVPIKFGADITPLEIICASSLISSI